LTARKLGEGRCEVSYEKIRAVYPGFWSYQRGCLLAAVHATGYTKATVVVSRPRRSPGQRGLHRRLELSCTRWNTRARREPVRACDF